MPEVKPATAEGNGVRRQRTTGKPPAQKRLAQQKGPVSRTAPSISWHKQAVTPSALGPKGPPHPALPSLGANTAGPPGDRAVHVQVVCVVPSTAVGADLERDSRACSVPPPQESGSLERSTHTHPSTCRWTWGGQAGSVAPPQPLALWGHTGHFVMSSGHS